MPCQEQIKRNRHIMINRQEMDRQTNRPKTTERQTNGQKKLTDRQTNKNLDRQTNRPKPTERQTNGQKKLTDRLTDKNNLRTNKIRNIKQEQWFPTTAPGNTSAPQASNKCSSCCTNYVIR